MIRLLFGRSFLPLFVTQFLNAFNDNVFKNALVLLVVYKSYTIANFSSNEVVSIASFLFTLPYFIFSPQAGYLADHYSRSQLIRWIKTFEILFMLLALVGFYFQSPGFLIFVLFLMGAQSAFFGPAKLGILPQLVSLKNLLKVNGIFCMGTFVAILIGTAVGGIVMKFNKESPENIGYLVVIFSALGLLTSLLIPKTVPTKSAERGVNFNIVNEIFSNLKMALEKKNMGRIILVSVWIWFLGNYFLILIPTYVKESLSGDEGVATAFMAIFSIGIAIGSVICTSLERFFKNNFSISKIGLLGMLICLLIAIGLGQYRIHNDRLITISEFAYYPTAMSIFFTYMFLAIFAGFFIVPIQTYIQSDSPPEECSQMISAMNIIQSIGVLAAAAILFILFKFNASHNTCLLFALAVGIGIYFYFSKTLKEFEENSDGKKSL